MSTLKIKPTDEQTAILDAFESGQDIRVQAGAGSGKTSTLVLLAREKLDDTGTFIAYNRAIKDDAAAKLPFNTEAVTSHSLAFRAVGVKYKHRLNGSRLTVKQTAEIMGVKPLQIGEHPVFGNFVLTRLVSDMLRRFTYSADDDLKLDHVSEINGFSEAEQKELARYLLPYARKAWADITNVDGRLRFEHDHYFKMWAMSHPTISDDFLFLDEAQDANPALTGVVAEQTHLQRVSVGDSAQSIYGWRGAKDALKVLPGDQLTLSQSFRFGDAIAEVANEWLDVLDADIRLTGFDQVDSRVVGWFPDAGTVLCRTNMGCMGEAMLGLERGQKVAIVGGTKQIEDLAKACLELQEKGNSIHPELVAFGSWDEVVAYSEDGGEDLKPMVKLIGRYGAKGILYACNRFDNEERSSLIVSTAHKAKGREWDSVRIGDDFSQTPDEETGVIELPKDEAMLAYVAVTRARNVLACEALDWIQTQPVVIV
jgi:superfamily I DNA/RNA helicase